MTDGTEILTWWKYIAAIRPLGLREASKPSRIPIVRTSRSWLSAALSLHPNLLRQALSERELGRRCVNGVWTRGSA